MILPFDAPEGYSYEIEEEYAVRYARVWLLNHKYDFVHNDGEPTRSVYCFINKKSGKFYAPITHKKVGQETSPEYMTPYSGMRRLNDVTQLSD